MDLNRYADRIIELSDKIKAARDADTALAALEELNAHVSDHSMLRTLAVMFQMLAREFIEAGEGNDHTERGSTK